MTATSTEEIVEALRASLKDVERLKQQNNLLSEERHESIAIVGMGCRYPGGVSSPEEMWDLLVHGGDAISAFPDDRGWDLEKLYDPDPDNPWTSYTREGGFLHDAADFDAAFFGIGPREALAMDPQQRVLLETCWQAVEDAGIDPLSLKGSQAGVFMGISSQDYLNSVDRLPKGLEGYGVTGVSSSVVSGRVAYTFGCEGPAVTIDTACSSSLVALHLACQALRSGDCSLALVGGVTVLATPRIFTEFSRQRGLSPDGRCRSFSDRADGTGLSEGVGVVLVERLSDARRLGHEVLAVARGCAINQDGASNGLTAPNGPSQQRVIHQALANARVPAGEVDVVEGHGTGTTLGDPIEAQALLATYGRDRQDGRPLWLGSVKSNIGHTQAAAGIAGVIKMVLALRHGLLPKTLHIDVPSRRVDWSEGSVSLLVDAVPWTCNGRPRRAGVSSFGISGTNAHVILEEAPVGAPEGAGGQAPSDGVLGGETLPWVLSGRGASALRAQAERLHVHLARADELDLAEVGHTLVRKRAAFSDRAVVLGCDREELLGGLRALADGQAAGNMLRGVADCSGPVAFMFPGQGSQWAGMATELLDGSRVFAESLRACEEALDPFVEWSLTDVLRDSDGALLERVDVVQPALFSVMVSLAALWRACGVRPSFVMGHSQGEIAAACVAGGLSLHDGALVVASRSKALVGLSGKGGMVSIACSERELEPLLEGFGGEISLAAVNGPGAVVVSGEPDALSRLLTECESGGVRARRIPVDYAAHSVQVEAIAQELLEACASISPCSGEIPFYSAVTGGILDTAELDAGYWYRNLRETVRFERSAAALVEAGCRAFVEVSPHPVLTVSVQETVELCLPTGGSLPNAESGSGGRDGVLVAGSLRRDEGGPRRFLSSLGELWVRGLKIDWEAVLAGDGLADVPLPTYAFQHERYWLEGGRGAGDPASIGLSSAKHPLLGAASPIAGEGDWLFTGRLSLDSHPWLTDHVVMGSALVPGTAFLELALHAAGRVGCDVVAELVIEAPLILEEDRAVQLQVAVSGADEAGLRSVSVHSRLEPSDGETLEEWVRHAAGTLMSDGERSAARTESIAMAGEWPPQDAEPVLLDGLYDRLAEIGLEYGPAFQGLRAAWRRGQEVFAEVALPADHEVEGDAFAIDPAMLDAALHALGSVIGDVSDGVLRLPFAWSGVRLHATEARSLRVTLIADGESTVSLSAVDDSGASVISVDSLLVRDVSAEQLQAHRGARSDSLYRIGWTPLAAQEEPVDDAEWALLDPDGRRELTRAGGGASVDALDAPAVFADLAALRSAIEGERAPRVVLVECSGRDVLAARASANEQQMGLHEHRDSDSALPDGEELPLAVRRSAQSTLRLLQDWFADERFADSLLVLVTHGAVAVAAGEGVVGLVDAPLWGLARSAQLENPGRLGLIDVDGERDSWSALRSAVALIESAGEPQLAIRRGNVYTPRLLRGTAGALSPPAGEACWRLAIGEEGTLEDLRLAASPEVSDPLGQGQVRVAMRAAGVNFRDVVAALGIVALRDENDAIGSEGAGVVLEVGRGVDDLAPGDRVLGLFTGAFGPQAVTDRQLLLPIPSNWSFAQGAAMPAAFLTAYYGLVDLAGIKAGERVLVHAAAGGVGMAAVQLALQLGAEVFGTASPAKWGALKRLGLDEAHIASSRDAEFEQRFLATSEGHGVDIVLNSLTGELLDASLELMCDGGRFLEMGKADIRDPADLAKRWPDMTYRAFDLIEAGPERIQKMLCELLELFGKGSLDHSPIRTWDVRRAPEAFRFMAQARHSGKIVLTVPGEGMGTDGTILITGGTGGLGALVAMHLAERHGARSLVLASRRGPEAPGAVELERALAKLGAEVEIVACDVTDRQQVRQLLESIPSEFPLHAVVHAAGALDDCLIASLTPERLDAVLAAKVDAAWNLHELTRDMDLDAFVLFSSFAGVMGGPGQGNYAAANTFLDALAAQRRSQGLQAVSMAWGRWEDATGLTAGLSEADLSRMRRSGIAPISSAEGLRLLDAAWADVDALTVPTRLDIAALRAGARAEALPAMLRDLVRLPLRAATRDAGGLLAERLKKAPVEERSRIVVQLVRGEVAAVLGHRSPEAIDVRRALSELGFDSLLAVELRNRLNTTTGLRLAATLVFDYPTVELVASHVLEQVSGLHSETRPAAPAPRAYEEPLAIVGMACRLPGGVRSPEDFWQLLASGGDGISDFPSDRGWELERLYDPEALRPGTTYIREGGFLHDVADFDAAFFGISPREALAMDPQQRLLLEVSWEALENAGIRPDSLRGSGTGVFAGTTGQDYGSLMTPESLEGFMITGLSASVLSGRIAYTLGLEGPAISVDTACSSSLVAIHMASQALRSGECSLALAGGAALMSTPIGFVEFSHQRVLARDARCKSFADAADGTNWGEGAGLVLLERLSDAERLGHRVLAVVRGGAVNQDGASNGLAAPNGPSQQRVIREALANSGLSAGEVDAVEAHGTGTKLGDPIEAQALLATYGHDRPDGAPLWLGSAKSNIGHTQAAAGVAGVIKMVLALRHGLLPRTLHVDAPSSQVDWSSGSVSLLTDAVPWRRDGRPRRAGISSFGLSGTNAHLILEEAPVSTAPRRVEEARVLEQGAVFGEGAVFEEGAVFGEGAVFEEGAVFGEGAVFEEGAVFGEGAVFEEGAVFGEGAVQEAADDEPGRPPGGPSQNVLPSAQGSTAATSSELPNRVLVSQAVPWVLSGRGEDGLRAQAARLGEFLVQGKAPNLRDVGLSLATTRTMLDRRALVVGNNLHELSNGLQVLASGEPATNVVEGRVDRGSGVAFVFPGQGSQWIGMAGELLTCSSVFAEAIDECAEALAPFVDWSLIDVLGDKGDPGLLDRIDVVQPALFAVMVALAGLWRACGVQPDMVMGHSQGEVAAAHIAGGLSLQDASRVIALRSRLLIEMVGSGNVVSVMESLERVREIVARCGEDMAIAGVNGPRSVAVSGDGEALGKLLVACEAQGVRAREVPATVPTHSPRVDALRERLLEQLEPIEPRSSKVPFYSTVTGGVLDTCELNGDYWYRNMRNTVEFEKASRMILQDGCRTFIEVSAHPVLTVSLGETVDAFAADGVSGGAGVVGSLRRGDGGPVRFMLSLGEAWARGAPVEWEVLFDDRARVSVSLPTYAFQRKRYWPASQIPKGYALDAGDAHAGFWEVIESEDASALASTLGMMEERERSSLEHVLPALAAWQRRRHTDSVLDSWRYRIAWKRLSDPVARLTGIWPVVIPAELSEDEWVLSVVAALESHGAHVVPVRVEQDCALDRRAMAAQLKLALEGESLGAEDGAGPDPLKIAGLVSLFALDERSHPSNTAVPVGLAAVVTLAQAIEELAIDGRLWLLTRAAVTAASSDRLAGPVQSMVWGLGRTLGLEQPGRLGALVDLPALLDGGSLERLCAVLGAGGEEDQLAVRSAGLFARRLVRAPASAPVSTESWRPRGTVLVTGATGGVGGHVARWLARAGAQHLLLASRRGLSAPGAAELVAELEQLGAQVSVVACDVADRDGVEQLLGSIPAEHPLDAVMHAAGIGQEVALDELTSEQLQITLAPKVAGALNLHELTAGMELSAFVLFSSLASLTGAAGQGEYSAANAYLDALAEHRRACGLTATSIAWGLWGGEGGGKIVGEKLRRRGAIDMAPELAISGLQQALDRDETCLAVMDIDWELYAPTYAFARSRPLIEDLPDVQWAATKLADGAPSEEEHAANWAAELGPLTERERERAALELVRSHAFVVLGYDTPDSLDVRQPFRELGFDSLMAVELRNRLAAATGLALATTVVFDYPSCVDLSEYITSQVFRSAAPGGGDLDADIDSLERALASLVDERDRARTVARLQELAVRFADNGESGRSAAVAEQIHTATDEEIFGFIDNELESL